MDFTGFAPARGANPVHFAWAMLVSITQFRVAPREGGGTLAAVLRRRLSLTWTQSRRFVEQRRVRIDNQPCIDSARRLRVGQNITIEFDEPKGERAASRPKRSAASAAERESPTRALPSPALVHVDDQIVVIEKPAGLTTVRHADETAEFGERGKRFLPRTLAEMLPRLLGDDKKVRAVHRLDRDTSGLVVFARTKEAEADLGKQFRAHTVGRRYLALVRGRPPEGRFESSIVRNRGDGRRGSSPDPSQGQRAVTHVKVVEELGKYSLVECRLETGRTHQVRIHLAELGAPLCGETVYDRPLHGAPLPDGSGASRIALHAAFLGLKHLKTKQWLQWESPLPADMDELLKRLRAAKTPRT
jgi:23S rRNA pseudouridine1911/1915/1917 synthase